VEQALRERDRLLRECARVVGLTALGVSLLCLVMPGVLPGRLLVVVVLLVAVVGGCLVRVGVSTSPAWPVVGIVAGIGVVLIAAPVGAAVDEPLVTALVPLAGGALSAFGIVLVGSPRRLAVLAAAVVASTALIGIAAPRGFLSVQPVTVVLGWILAVVFAYWYGSGVPRVTASIVSIGRAHRAERHASETEAQRRQSARLLHDTVLATLTLLAHSGIGVSSDALRDQARDDASLLRQLRLGGSPVPTSTGSVVTQPPTSSEITLGHTLESVKQRFGRMGLDVSWHGTGQVLLPTEVLDAFLLALAECLENVRRHSGVSDAHVTITDDDDTVRAMVTDSGVGFAVDQVDAGRLGFRDSIVGRLDEVGGSARVFSSPGAGTTVVLEVPR
jgi:signal transduction histidine kinase